ncbi:Protein MIZU-KUSSEI 1 [Linum grandiflorum]
MAAATAVVAPINPTLPPVRTRPTKSSGGGSSGGGGGGGIPTPISQSPESESTSVAPVLQQAIQLHQPISKRSNPSRPKKLLRQVRSMFRSFPIIAPAACKFPAVNGTRIQDGQINGTRMTGTLFGHKKARVSLAIQESPSSLPVLVLELGMPTGKLLQSMGNGMVRIAMECEKRIKDKKTKIADEPIWTMFCNGRKTGFGLRREATAEDLQVMQTLHVISMGAGVIPEGDGVHHPDGEMAYMRAHFERVVGSRDSETYYMMNPDGNSGPELSIFFVRV